MHAQIAPQQAKIDKFRLARMRGREITHWCVEGLAVGATLASGPRWVKGAARILFSIIHAPEIFFNKIVQKSVENHLARGITARTSSGLHGLHYDGACVHKLGI
jgi:hypothetical protein